MNNWFKVYIVDIIPCLSIAIYILGVIYNVSFFSFYDINVLHYITFNELLISTIEPLIILSLFALFMCIALLLCIDSLQNLAKEYVDSRKKYRTAFRRNLIKLMSKNKFIYKYVYPKLKGFRFNSTNKPTNDNPTKNSGLVVILYGIICYFTIYFYNNDDSGLMGMSKATLMLLFLVGFFLILFFDIPSLVFSQTPLKHDRMTSTFSRFSSLEISGSIFVFFLTAVIIFYKAGKETAEYNKNHDDITFAIKTSGQQCFDNQHYHYIEQLNENVFLYEKETNNVIILNKSNIESIKINFNRKRSISIFDELRTRNETKTNKK